MKAGVKSVVLAAALLTGGTAVASSQTSAMHLGPQVAYDFDFEAFGIGAQFSVPIMRRLEFYPSFMYYFADDPLDVWNLNADLKYRVASDRPNWLYLGTGLNLTRVSNGGSDTDAGLNLFAGAESLKGRIHPFAEARLVLSDGSRFQLAAGLNITIGGH